MHVSLVLRDPLVFALTDIQWVDPIYRITKCSISLFRAMKASALCQGDQHVSSSIRKRRKTHGSTYGRRRNVAFHKVIYAGLRTHTGNGDKLAINLPCDYVCCLRSLSQPNPMSTDNQMIS